MSAHPFFGIPEASILKRTAPLAGAFACFFYGIYFLSDQLAAQRNVVFSLAMQWERHVPLIEWTAVLYLSIGPVMAMAPFVIRDIEQFWFGIKLLSTQVLIAAPIFVLFPVAETYPDVELSGPFAGFVVLADHMNLDYNEVPSLHVAFALTTAYLFSHSLGTPGRALLIFWAALVCVSTLLTHQHHVAGLAAGAMLAFGSIIFVSWVQAVPQAVKKEQAATASR